MRIYEVRNEFDIQSVVADDPDKFNPRGGKLGEPIGGIKLPVFYIDQPKKQLANFYNFYQNLWLFDGKVKAAMKRPIEAAGELFVIDVEQVGTLNVLNVLEKCDNGLDHAASRWRREGKQGGLLKYSFVSKNIETKSGLFIIPEDRYSRTYAVTNSPRQGCDFYQQYCDSGLSGLRFDFMWADE